MKKIIVPFLLFISIQLPAQQKDTLQLKGVTVEGRKPFITMKAGKMVLDVAASPLSAGQHVLEILQLAPGVQVDAQGKISLNGKSVTVYIDDRPSYLSADALKALLTGKQGHSIDKIELISNPSARYDASGGALINIRLKKEKGMGTNGTLTLGAGMGAHLRTSNGVFVQHRSKKTTVYGGYDFSRQQRAMAAQTWRTAKGFRIGGDENGTTVTQNHQLRAGIDHMLNTRTTAGIAVNGMYADQDSRRTSTAAFFSKQAAADSVLTASTRGDGGFFTPAVNAYLKTRLDSTGRELSFNGDYYTFSRRRNNLFDTRTENGEAYTLEEHSPQLIRIGALSADYKHPSRIGQFDAGLKTIFIKTDNDTRWQQATAGGWVNDAGKTNHFIYKEWIAAGYLNYSRDWQKWSLQGGLRLENTSTNGRSLTSGESFRRQYVRLFPNVAIKHSLNAGNELSLSYRKSINRPSYAYVNPFLTFENKYAYFRGNPDLGPEMAHNAELTHSFKNTLFTTISYMRYNGVVSQIYEQDEKSRILYSTYANLRYSEWYFLGVSYNKQFTSWWSNNTSLQGGYIRYRFDSTALQPSVPGFFFSTVNAFSIPDVCNVQAAFSYSSRVASGLQEMKSYWGLNIGVQRSIWRKRADIKLNMTDIFRTMQQGNISDYNGVRVKSESYNDNRTVTLTFVYRFGHKDVRSVRARRSGIEQEQNRISR
ncbi:outer membrane beta-barrel protein [Chitinophaga lutea]|nr:outer membrane beta-barrel protein [Chitinophaga lutea]